MSVETTERLSAPIPGPPRPLQTPKVAEQRLRTGLRVLVVRKPTVPKVEVQLVVPLGRRSPTAAPERILAKTFTSGTSSRSSVDIAIQLQKLGASLDAGTSADNFGANGSVLAPNLKPYLELLAEVLTDSVFPENEVALERDRVVQEIQIARSQPQFLAHEAVRQRLFGRHPYGVVQPEPAAVGKVGRAAVRRLYAERLLPRDAVLVVVGDVQPQTALKRAEESLGAWKGRKAVPALPDPPPVRTGPTLIVDRPGSVQTNIRLAGPSLPLGHPDSYALECANAIFGGTFGSRLTMNIREDKGYTYSPFSVLQHLQRASYFETSADVGTDVTAPSLVETRYELGRMSALEVEKEELETVQRYLTGIMAIRIQSQRGLAGQLARLAAFGFGVEYLKEHPRRISAVTTADVRDVCKRYLAPGRLVTVLVGDASRIAAEVEALEPIDVKLSASP